MEPAVAHLSSRTIQALVMQPVVQPEPCAITLGSGILKYWPVKGYLRVMESRFHL